MASDSSEEEVKKVSPIMAHQSLAQKRAGFLAKKSRQVTSFLRRKSYLASIAWTLKAKKPSRGAFQMRTTKRYVWPRNTNKREEASSLLRRWF